MRVFQWFRMAGVVAFLVLATPAMAQNCAGFTDVTNDGPTGFCPGVDWLKNRGITSGCGGTLYCPTAPVNRLAMAKFLYEVGKKLTPEDMPTVAFTSVGQVNLNTPPILCQTVDYPVTGYPRRAMFNSKVNVYSPSADVELVVDVMYSTNAGAPGSWISVTGSQTFQTLRSGGAVVDDVSMYPIGFWDLQVGQTYRFGIRVARQTGAGNPNIYCENRVSITNRNGTSSPYDEEPVERIGRAAQLPPQ